MSMSQPSHIESRPTRSLKGLLGCGIASILLNAVFVVALANTGGAQGSAQPMPQLTTLSVTTPPPPRSLPNTDQALEQTPTAPTPQPIALPEPAPLAAALASPLAAPAGNQLLSDSLEFSLGLPAYAGAKTLGSWDTPPELLFVPDLSRLYPKHAKSRRLTGRSTLRLRISATGDVLDVDVVSSTPPGIFDEAAKTAGRQLRFRPGSRQNMPTTGTVQMELEWALPDTDW